MMREAEVTANANVVPIASRRRMNVWMPIAAAAMLVVVIGSPLLLSRAKAPAFEVGHGHPIDLSAGRGPEDQVVTVQEGESIVLYADIPASPAYTRYEIRVVDAKGTLVVPPRSVSPEQAKDSLPLVLRGLGAGTYDLVVIGDGPAGQHAEVARTQFIVKRSGVNALRRERWNSHTTQAHLALAA